MGRLPEAWIAPPQVRELREVTRYRLLTLVFYGLRDGQIRCLPRSPAEPPVTQPPVRAA